MKATTEALESRITTEGDFENFLSKCTEDMEEKTLSDYLAELLEKHGKSKREILEHTYIDVNYGYQIFNGTKKNPGRDLLLQFALVFPLTLKETKHLLYYGGASGLYPRNKRDAYFMFALSKKYSLEEVNRYLTGNDLMPFREGK